MKKLIPPVQNAEQIAFCKSVEKEVKAGNFIFVRDEAHEIELWKESRLKNAIAGTKKKR